MWSPHKVEVLEVALCGPERSAIAFVTAWLRDSDTPGLIAIDAPLGWPQGMAKELSGHRAGEPIHMAPNELFRRETDRFIQRTLRKTPLDVGADRIARTAHAALRVLGEIRRELALPIPLAWFSPPQGVAAIEVYPAATLLAHGIRASGYKRSTQVEARQEIITALARIMTIKVQASLLETSADALDAVVCLLAAKDFLDGGAVGPTNREVAEIEGWIWAPSF
jgi:predicted nuclease with RNAse H fold